MARVKHRLEEYRKGPGGRERRNVEYSQACSLIKREMIATVLIGKYSRVVNFEPKSLHQSLPDSVKTAGVHCDDVMGRMEMDCDLRENFASTCKKVARKFEPNTRCPIMATSTPYLNVGCDGFGRVEISVLRHGFQIVLAGRHRGVLLADGISAGERFVDPPVLSPSQFQRQALGGKLGRKFRS